VSSTAPVVCARSCVHHRSAWCVAMLVPQDVGGGESAGMLGGGRWKGEGWRWLPFASPSSQPSSFASSSSILFFSNWARLLDFVAVPLTSFVSPARHGSKSGRTGPGTPSGGGEC
jgi:hypothetical protein